MSVNFAIRTKNIEKAEKFYSNFLGFPIRSKNENEIDINAHPMSLFVIKDDEPSVPILELFVDDLEIAKEELLAKGCTIIKLVGKGKYCYIKDPFGVVFNIWEKCEKQ